ncbi:MAG: calcium/sodium antiporter [Candidatus Nanoarchaeia archaeon]
MILEVILFIFGFILLIKGADFFVKSASIIAKKLGVSQFIIGLTLVAIGTSLPELGSTIIASIKGQGGIVVGHLIGANIANLGLIAGISSLLSVVVINKKMVKREGYLMLFTAIIFFLFCLNAQISRIEAAIMFLMYISYMFFIFDKKYTKDNKNDFRSFINYVLEFKYLKYINYKPIKKKAEKKYLLKDGLIMILSGLALFIGAKLIIDGTIFLSNQLNIAPDLIAISVLAFGTTLPELSVAVSSIQKKLGNIALGNIVGSCIANLLLIASISAFINPISVSKLTLYYTAPFLILMSSILLIFMKTKNRLKKFEGIALYLLYTLFIMSLLFINTL